MPTSLLSALHEDDQVNTFLLSQIGKISDTLNSPDFVEKPELHALVDTLSTIHHSGHASTVFSLLPTIRSSLKKHPLPLAQSRSVLAAVESIEPIQHQPILVFAKSGSDLFKSTNDSAEIVDTTTPSHLFPIPFSTGYKEGDIRAEMQQIYDQMTSLVPDRFPVERVTLSHPPKASNKSRHQLGRMKKKTRLEHQWTWRFYSTNRRFLQVRYGL
ncbi:hypothetical protein BLNAU_17539 [Blattamonas nauphoetae]|uniref:Uncharacterized protein n=1 Tax=Blattamonas nauphoetae TaxID=2049346 RepID=A0ABQ9X6X1_9EUKA|nr:hypothetical protein BLNAU_17539 [Blattamonas nauphoetae]